MRTFRLVLAYDGTDFHGWQIQPAQRTVQGVVQEALGDALKDGAADLHGAGRTDAGVHARGQVASFRSDTRLPARAIEAELARRLPRDVTARSIEEVEDGFHARHSALARAYTFRTVEHEDPRWERFAWHPPRMPALAALDAATRALEGEHDCSSFRSSGSSPSDPVCRIVRARWGGWEFGSMLEIVANHFLYHMVRNVVGTALAAAREDDPAAAMRRVLAARDRSAAGLAAPAHGLSLEHVFYPPEVPA